MREPPVVSNSITDGRVEVPKVALNAGWKPFGDLLGNDHGPSSRGSQGGFEILGLEFREVAEAAENLVSRLR